MTKNYLHVLLVALFLSAGFVAGASGEVANTPGSAVHVNLTEEERAFLAGKELRLGIDENRPPFEFIDRTGAYAGISADFIALACKRLGISMVPQKGLGWTEAIKKTQTGEIDVIPKITPTSEREKILLFTRPYTTFPSVIVTRKDRSVVGLDDLNDLSVGVVKGLIVEKLLQRDRPDFTLVEEPDLETALRALSAGELDAFVDNLGAVTYVIDKVGLSNLKIAAQTPYTHDLAFGVRKDQPLLASALDKALATLTDQEKSEIKSRRLAIQYQKHIDWKVYGPIGGALIVIVIVVLIWNRRLGRVVKERARAEQALRLQTEELQAQQKILGETEAWYRGIIESAPDGILVADDRGTIILANAMAAEMFGYESGELLGNNIDILVPESIRGEHVHMRERFMQTRAVRDMGHGLDLRGVRRDGSEFPVEIGLSMLPPSGSRSPCVCASIRDVTERKAAELALADSRERLQVLLDTSPIAVALSSEGTLHFANPRFMDLFDIRIGEGTERLYAAPSYRKKIVDLLNHQEVVSDLEIQMIGNDGKVRDFLGTYLRTEHEGKPGLLCWLVDITRMKAIGNALTEAEERSRLLLESAGEGIFGVDTSGRMTFANPAALRLLGYREEELLGRKVHSLIHHSREDGSPYPVDECPMGASYGRMENHKVPGEVLWRKDGSRFYVDYSSTPMKKGGDIVGAVVTFSDVSERKKVEEEMHKYVNELERFNRLITGREMKMIRLKNEVNALRAELGRSAEYMVAVQAGEDKEFKIFGEEREESVFSMDLIGNIGEGRPNLGATIDVGVYRLMQFSIRDVILRKFRPEIASAIFYDAGEMTGREIYRTMIAKRESFEDFIKETKELLANLKIGILNLEHADMAAKQFTVTLSEDLDCSGLPASNETICSYDEGLLSGLLLEHTGIRFDVKEVSCWCTGDKLCRFQLNPMARRDADRTDEPRT